MTTIFFLRDFLVLSDLQKNTAESGQEHCELKNGVKNESMQVLGEGV